jgi:hypothetical protein
LQPLDFAGEVLDDQVDAVPAAGLGCAPVGHRSSGRAGGAAQQQTQVAPDDVGERGGGAGAQLKAEVGGVEGDGIFDVVDHVADIDVLVRHMLDDLLGVGGVFDLLEQEADARSSSAAVRAKGGRVSSSVPGSRPGSLTLQWIACGVPGSSGQISRTRPRRVRSGARPSVAQGDRVTFSQPATLARNTEAPDRTVRATGIRTTAASLRSLHLTIGG